MDYLKMWIWMTKLGLRNEHNAEQKGPYDVPQRWLHTCGHRPFSPSVSSVENNQHHCWLVRLLIGLLPDTGPLQWVVTRGRCSARWPWERKGTGLISHSSSRTSSGNRGGEKILHSSCRWQGGSPRTSGWGIHVFISFTEAGASCGLVYHMSS